MDTVGGNLARRTLLEPNFQDILADAAKCFMHRGYYRCTHKGCLADKEVQRDDEEPSLYNITYRGRHTCRQTSSATNSSINNEADLMTQSRVDDDDLVGGSLGTKSQRSDGRIVASRVTNSTPSFSGNQRGKSASDSDLEFLQWAYLDLSFDTAQLSSFVEFDDDFLVDNTEC
ncbi:probable WRKY transcription factor 30 [Prosopis cineraria]|uniref:probable WRKY transcription factor 30 n=1 Tax=Prosopis cineraria TaxID=364024 RepID=UPI00240F8683|nr:probable WRKY transcription factor 30 [Prosopis cineraria]